MRKMTHHSHYIQTLVKLITIETTFYFERNNILRDINDEKNTHLFLLFSSGYLMISRIYNHHIFVSFDDRILFDFHIIVYFSLIAKIHKVVIGGFPHHNFSLTAGLFLIVYQLNQKCF